MTGERLAAPGGTIASAITELAPVSYWKLDELSGNYIDSRPAGIVGTPVTSLARRIGGPTPDSGCVETNSRQGAAVATFGDNYGFAGNLSFTFVLFHKPELPSAPASFGTNTRRLLQKNDSAAGPFWLVNTAGQINCTRSGSGGPSAVQSIGIDPGAWNVYGFSYDAVTGLIINYYNGNIATATDLAAMPSSAGTNLRLNGEPTNAADWGSPGRFAHLAVWNRGLVPAELDTIRSAYRASR